jgi:alcohol dehydrogenase
VRDCAARNEPIDFLVGIGGGSAMDCAKGINFIHTNGGRMQDYWGIGKAAKLMLPMIAIPTTAGTGSEAQSFALITDPATHQKMACGDPKAMCRVAILDPDLTRTQPQKVAAAAGIDAVAHAVETAGCTKRNEISLAFSREAWLRLDRSFERAMTNPEDDAARADMLLGAHLAGCAIEHSMLGAAHACANPLTARCGITHGLAVGAMLPHVVRFNSRGGTNPYTSIAADADALATRLTRMLDAARLALKLRDLGVKEPMLPQLAAEAAEQWTAKFNPVAVNADDLLAIYRAAW